MTTEAMTFALIVLAALGLLSLWAAGARTGRRAERAVARVTRMGGNTARALAAAVVIAAAQWAVIASTTHPLALGVVLGVPALFAGASAVRMFAVNHPAHGRRSRRSRGGHR